MFIPGNRVIGQYVYYDAIGEAISISPGNSEWLSDIFNLINDPIMVTDAEGIIIKVNDSFAHIRGVSKQVLLGQNVKSFDPPSKICEVLKTRKAFRGLSHRDQDQIYIVDILPILRDSILLGSIMIVKDISVTNEADSIHVDYPKNPQYNTNNEFIGNDPEIIKLKEKILKVAKSDLAVLITGETGTGKELIARSIHKQSHRSNGPFIAVNCSTFSPGIIDSELFGYDDGSFTGSKRGGKMGLFEASNGGTLFLDEIGDMPIELQPKLLRVLEEHSIRRVGSNVNRFVDIRIIAATNKRNEDLLINTDIRSDLYYRLSGVNLYIPPLRDRKNDIYILIRYFLKELNERTGNSVIITHPALISLQSYLWPGNVRELKNTIMSLFYLCDKGVIMRTDLPNQINKSDDERNVISSKVFVNSAFEARKILLYEYLKNNKYISNKDYCNITYVNRATAFRDLSKLVAAKELTVEGMGRSTKYLRNKK